MCPDRPAPQKENGHHSQCDAQEDRAVKQGKDSRQHKKGENLVGKTDVAEGQEKRDDYQSRHDIPHPEPEPLKGDGPLAEQDHHRFITVGGSLQCDKDFQYLKKELIMLLSLKNMINYRYP